jgi:hypothetical protein
MIAQVDDWLAALQSGDRVIVQRAPYESLIRTVARCTATQIVLTHPSGHTTRYRRRDGREIGATLPDWLQPYTEEDAAAIRLAAMRQTLAGALQKVSRTQIDQLTPQQCRAVLDVLEAYGLYATPAQHTLERD